MATLLAIKPKGTGLALKKGSNAKRDGMKERESLARDTTTNYELALQPKLPLAKSRPHERVGNWINGRGGRESC